MSQNKNNQEIRDKLLNMPNDEFYKLMEDSGFELVASPDGKGGIIFTDYAVVEGKVVCKPCHKDEYSSLEIEEGNGWQTESGEIRDLNEVLAKFEHKRVRITVETIEDWE